VNQPIDENCRGCGVKRVVFKRGMSVVPSVLKPSVLKPIAPKPSVLKQKIIRRDHMPAPTRLPPAPPVPALVKRPNVLPYDVIADDCKCVGCTRNRVIVSLSMMKNPVNWNTGFIAGEGKFYKCVKTRAVYVDDQVVINSLTARRVTRGEIATVIHWLNQAPDTSAPEIIAEGGEYLIDCPHCRFRVSLPLKDVNCGIYRHGESHIMPHMTAQQITEAIKKKPSHGCLRGIAIKRVRGILRIFPTTLNDRIIAE
jgi:hypothetical protein